jgi:6,7-dimethyl-8-ribityllumazine synthase
MKIYEGNLIGTGLKIGIVVSRFNEFITSKLGETIVHSKSSMMQNMLI